MINGGFNGKSSVNLQFSIAMLNNQRVAPEAFFLQVTDGEKGHCFNKCGISVSRSFARSSVLRRKLQI